MKTANKIMMPNGEEIGIDGLYGKITNCLLEVPQRIKLELNNGTLTLKAGSQVIVPNGFEADGTTPKFDYVGIESDISQTLSGSVSDIHFVCFLGSSGSPIGWRILPSSCYSGSTVPTQSGNMLWYDTSTNLIKYYQNNVFQTDGFSFPIALCTRTSGAYTSIDQTFNGLGYIGSTVWVDKGVKGLIPNGRNKDGTFNNIEYITDKVYTHNVLADNKYVSVFVYNHGAIADAYPMVISSTPPTQNYTLYYKEQANELWSSGNGSPVRIPAFVICNINMTLSNGITSFNPKQPFRAVDWNDAVLKSDGVLYRNNKYEISSWSMPAFNYINLTLGASGAKYTAPASGWVWFQTLPCTTAGYQCLQNNSNGMNLETRTTLTNARCSVFLPVRRGDEFTALYDTQGTRTFRFYYAQGEV